jgi:DNA-binding CsgD family transcriptional regulator
VDWSFDLCTKPEQRLWARLAMFAGGFELDAVEGVCADEHLPEAELLELVAGLVDKSILARDDVGGGRVEAARYRMLETIRDYGQEQLTKAGERAKLHRRHRDWYQRLAERAQAEWISERQAQWLARLRREHANLRAAMEYCVAEPGEAETALQIAVTMPVHHWWGGRIGDGRHWLELALAKCTAATALRARALLLTCQLALNQGDADGGMLLLEQGEHLARRLDARAELAQAAFIRGLGESFQGDQVRALNTLERSLTILSTLPEHELDLDQRLNVLLVLLVAAGLSGDHERALACQQEMLEITEPRGETYFRAQAMVSGAIGVWSHGDFTQAAAQVTDGLRLRRACRLDDDRYPTAMALEILAWITASQRRMQRAATLLGTADALWTDLGVPITAYPHMGGHHRACERQARDALGAAAFTDAFRHGQNVTYEDAIAYALDEPRQPASAPHEDTATPLTRRERQVADLIAQGLSNKDIAAALVISQRTAESHHEHNQTKQGLTSRAQVAAWITEQHFDTRNA